MPLYDFKCGQGHEYEEVLSLADYQNETKCPKCGESGVKIIKTGSRGPTFSDKIFPYYDRSLNKVFNNKIEKDSYLKSKNLMLGDVSKQAEKRMYSWRSWGNESRHKLK